MNRGWTFRPAIWAVAGTLIGVAITCWLGSWQLRRGHAREALDAQYRHAGQIAPVALDSAAVAPANAEAFAAKAEGIYENRQLLLDNQVHEQVPGYEVLTPMRLNSGGMVLINRGWVPQNPDRRVLPPAEPPQGPQQVLGLWRALPQPALRLKTSNCKATGWPRVVEYPTAEDLACIYPDIKVAPGMLLLAPGAEHGFVREWTQADVRFPPSRHYAYAAQWFAFGATLLFLFFKLNLKRRT